MRLLSTIVAVIGLQMAAGRLFSAEPLLNTNPPPLLLTNAAQVLNLTADQAARALPVHLRAVVVDESEPREKALILEDQSACIYVFAHTNLFAPYHRTDLLELSGVTSPGQFAPCILVKKAQKLGWGGIPAARPVTYQQIITGALDAQFVKISGVVRQCLPALPHDKTWRIVLAADGGTLPVRMPLPQDKDIQEDAEVTVEAVCLYQFNQKRQALGPVLQVPQGVPVQIDKLSPADPYAAPVRLAASLLQYSHELPIGHRVHVRGVVTRAEAGSKVWIRDKSSGLRIQTLQDQALEPGDEIDAIGFPGYGASTPILEDAHFRKLRSLPPPVPITLTNPAEAYDHQDDLVRLKAMLTDLQLVQNGLVLTFEARATTFKGILKLPLKPNVEPAWEEGSLVYVSGICDVIPDDSRPVMGIWHPQAFQVLLRSPGDVAVIEAPSWWTARHIIYILGLFATASLAASGFVLLLARSRLNQQSQRRAMAEAEFAAILSERNRLAREIHDTLAQGLTATAVQLQLMKIHANGATESMNRHLDKAQQMVRESLEEARNSIWNMRSQILETGDLVSALKNILARLSEGIPLETQFEVAGRPRRLPAVIENNVLRLGQEAITNAVKHANARQIAVKLEFAEKHFSLIVTDDGIGFDPGKPPCSEGGFGLVGMAERAKELNGKLKVRSASNAGTEVILNIPLVGE